MVDAAPQTTASIQDLKAIDANEGSFKLRAKEKRLAAL
jgi:hypothetical protein